MPQPPNRFLRVVVPIVLMLGGIGVAAAVWINSSRPSSPSTTNPTTKTPSPSTGDATKPKQPEAVTPPADGSKPVAETPAGQAPSQPPTAAPAGTVYAAEQYPYDPAHGYDPIGSVDPASKDMMEVRFSPFGAGIETLDLREHYTDIYEKTHERLQSFQSSPADPRAGIAPFAVAGIAINGVNVPLAATPASGTYWKQTAPGSFEANIKDAEGKGVARITRQYQLEPGSYDIILRQRIENLTTQALSITWAQFGPSDPPMGTTRESMDKRRVRFGYLSSPQIDPSQQLVSATKFLIDRHKAMGVQDVDPGTGLKLWRGMPLWPNQDVTDKSLSLVWLGISSRHFCVVMHPLVDPQATRPDKRMGFASRVSSLVVTRTKADGKDDSVLGLTMLSDPVTVPASGGVSLDAGIYAGPMSKKYITAKSEPRAEVVGIDSIVVYTLGGPCGFCTFQSITGLLYWFLGILNDYVFHDYALGIIFLVVCMRTILHPVTKHAQVSMQRFSKQMQGLAPKQKKIQERYAGDQQKMREEMARLMREEHISYGSMAKGCLTPFLQTPVWIALYAMLFFMFELRHEAAFFGVFQWLSEKIAGVKWSFLADLSEPDHFIAFGKSYHVWGLSSLTGDIDGLNILPLLLGVVFFIQQKYLTPPATTPLTPEQEQQQKIMKVMTVVMFPMFMYNQASGLTLYFVVNSSLGILESRYIRAHAAKLDLSPKPKKVGGSSKPGFLERLQAAAEAKQKMLDQRQKEAAKKKPKR